MKTISTQHNTDAIERKHPWPMVRLGDVCETISTRGHQIKQSEIRESGKYPVVSQSENDVEGWTDEDIVITQVPLVLFGDHTCVVKKIEFPFVVGADGTKILKSKSHNNTFLFYALQRAVASLVDGKYRRHYSDLVEIEIPLPPLPVQREIVARLERELAAVEKMKKGFEALAETAKAEFKAELKEVFESGELRVESGELAVRRVKLGEICETITDGDHQPPPKSSQGVPFLVISNVASGRISFENTRFVPRAYYEAIQENRKPRKGDVLLTVTGSYGIPVVVETDDMFCFQRHIALIRASRLDSKFLAYVLQSPESKRYFDLVATGAAQKTIGLGSIRAMSIPFPSMSAQRQIVDRLSAAKARTEKLEAKAREGVAVCETMRKAILKEAFE